VRRHLTSKEQKVADLMLVGYPDRQIANELHINRRNVEYHVVNIYKHYGVSRRVDFIKIYFRELQEYNEKNWDNRMVK